MSLLTRTAIRKAIKCENWQTLRVALKGQSTEEKLKVLKKYLLGPWVDEGTMSCCDYGTRWVQVYNYLNALSRGGQIKPVWTRDLEDDKVVILK